VKTNVDRKRYRSTIMFWSAILSMSFFMGLFKFLNAISLLGSGNVRFLLLNFFAMGFFGEAHFTDGCATLGRHKEYYLMWPKIKAVLFEFVNGDVKRCSNAELKCFDEKSIKIFWLKSPAEIFIRLDTNVGPVLVPQSLVGKFKSSLSLKGG
jgi:hypothetical protein